MVRSGKTAWSVLVCFFLTLTALVVAAPAYAAYGVESFDGLITADQTSDVSYAQAGGHPYAVFTSFTINTKNDPANGKPWPDEPIKDVLVDVPPGLVGNPTIIPTCSLDELANVRGPTCSPASQIGRALVTYVHGCFPGACFPFQLNVSVFNLLPPPDVPARFGFVIAQSVITLDAEVRSGSDYGLSVNVKNAPAAVAVIGTALTLWGVPADPVHTPERHCPGTVDDGTVDGCAAGVPPQAFLTMPTSCLGPQTTTLRTDSWFHPGDFVTASFVSHQTAAEGEAPIGNTGCDLVPFDPTFEAQPDTPASPGVSGWTFDLRIPQDDITDPNAIAQSHLRKAVVTLPEGVRVSPASADGLAACSPAQVKLDSADAATCPDAAKIGAVTIDTPVLEDDLTGGIYLATPNDNPFDSLVAVYLVAEGPGVVVKLPGEVSLDPNTGRVTTTFDENPQLPFSHLHLEFFGGPRAALTNPPRCGTHTTTAELTSWSGKTVTIEDSFTTSHDGQGAPCPPARFEPELNAGTMTEHNLVPAGGSHSSFVLNLLRTDDDEELAALQSVDMPDGLLAKIASVPLCAPANVAAGTCGEASRIGTVTTAAGTGPNPFAVQGRLYLGGPYQGAPFSLSIVVPAVAGPFDLGTIVLRAAIFVDPATAKLKIKTDPLPTILQGIPLQLKWISVLIDRSDFIVNPTSCNVKSIGATAVSTAGTAAQLSSRFKVNDCASLELSPRMRLRVGSRRHTQAGRSTPFRTVLTQPPGQAGLKAVSVTLPSILNARLAVVNDACTQAEFDAGNCGKNARAGRAVAVTPLLPEPLKGSAYFVKNPDRAIPDLVIALRGQVAFNLVGKIEIPGGKRLRTVFDTVPDVPIKRFTLRLFAGENGPLGVARNLCTARSRRQVAQIAIRGQNGKLEQTNQRLTIRGCKKGKRR